MNRFILAAAVALLTVGTGCATGIEDPQPQPAPATQSHGGATPFSAELEEATPDPNVVDNGLTAPAQDLEAPPPVEETNQPNLKTEEEAPVNG